MRQDKRHIGPRLDGGDRTFAQFQKPLGRRVRKGGGPVARKYVFRTAQFTKINVPDPLQKLQEELFVEGEVPFFGDTVY
jgi:hypothetical protein